MFKKIMAALLAAALSSALFAGCSGGESSASSSGAAAPASSAPASSAAGSSSASEAAAPAFDFPDADNVNPKGEFPIVKEPIELKIAMPQNARISDYDDNQYTKMIEEKSGIDMVFDLLPAKDTASKVKLLFASDDLPEVFMGVGGSQGMDTASIMEYADQGMIIPLNDYIDAYGDEIFNLWEEAEDKNVRNLMTFADGNIYSLVKYSEQYVNLYNQRCYIYGPWLEKLGLEPATTTDEFADILRAFKSNDLNGNGKADEIPFIDSVNAAGELPQAVLFLMNSFIFYDTTHHMTVENGTLTPAFTQPAFKDGLAYMHMLVEEGLFDPISFTQDNAQLKAIINQDDPLVGSYVHQVRTTVTDITSDRSRDLVAQPPLKGPNGVNWMPATPPVPQQVYQITKDCKNPAAAFRLGDMMMNKEISVNARYGFEGTDWKKPEAGALGYNGEPAVRELIQDVWGMSSQNTHWQWPNPGFMKYGTHEGLAWDGDEKEYNYFQLQYGLKYVKGLQPEESLPQTLIMTAEEMDEFSVLQPQIKTYMQENVTKFIVGDRSLDEWDAYVAEYDKMGIDRYVAILQSAYERTTGNA
ncbi:MAG: extracellular solute-binding protein [Provencibacterium sp.]|jgi:putative aldouronate transport system substrate-binding protein|nr:extracellular solute-binding protein [Provencibacterium sp.]